MALPYNAIGSFTFDALLGQATIIQQRPEIFVRPGVSGMGIFWGGLKGEPFTLRSHVGLSDRATAIIRFEQYTTLSGLFADVWQADTRLADLGQFLVLNVSIVDKHAIGTAIGTDLANAAYMLTADWTLVHIYN